jgi:hypothetical protein
MRNELDELHDIYSSLLCPFPSTISPPSMHMDDEIACQSSKQVTIKIMQS